MDTAAALQQARESDLAEIMQDYPCKLFVGPTEIEANVNQLSLSPYGGERGLSEDGTITAVGKTAALRAAGTVKTADQVRVQRYGEAEPRTYTVSDISMDSVMFTLALIPVSTKRNLGVML